MRCLLVVGLLCASIAHAAPDLRMPRGTRTDASGQLVSGRGLRDTTDFLAKELDRRGIAVRQVGPYRVRGVELTRFVSQTPSTPWLAIHVLRIGRQDPDLLRPAREPLTKRVGSVIGTVPSLGDRLMAGRKTLTLAI